MAAYACDCGHWWVGDYGEGVVRSVAWCLLGPLKFGEGVELAWWDDCDWCVAFCGIGLSDLAVYWY